jgi:AcrR family transcriptional regulator
VPVTSATDQTPSFQRILDAGRDLFVENGFPATSMEAIARRAHVVRATVYNNFHDKEAILDEIMRQYVEGYVEIPRRLREQARPEQTSFELLEEMIRSAIRWRMDNAPLRPLIDLAKHLPNSAWHTLDAQADEAMLGWVMEIHRRDAELGRIRDDVDLDFATSALYSMIEAVIASFDVGTKPDRAERAVRQLAMLHWHAIYRLEPDELSDPTP